MNNQQMDYQKISFVPDLKYGKVGDAGLDLVNAGNATVVPANGSAVLSTGIAVSIPYGCFGLVLMRSGHGFKKDLISHPGVIDSGYRGEIKVKVFNLSETDVTIEMDERFCQLLIIPFVMFALNHVPALENSDRGTNGFGSTGS